MCLYSVNINIISNMKSDVNVLSELVVCCEHISCLKVRYRGDYGIQVPGSKRRGGLVEDQSAVIRVLDYSSSSLVCDCCYRLENVEVHFDNHGPVIHILPSSTVVEEMDDPMLRCGSVSGIAALCEGVVPEIHLKLQSVYDTTDSPALQRGRLVDTTGMANFVIWEGGTQLPTQCGEMYCIRNAFCSRYRDRWYLDLTYAEVCKSDEPSVVTPYEYVDIVGWCVRVFPNSKSYVCMQPDCGSVLDHERKCAFHGYQSDCKEIVNYKMQIDDGENVYSIYLRGDLEVDVDVSKLTVGRKLHVKGRALNNWVMVNSMCEVSGHKECNENVKKMIDLFVE